MSTRKGVRFHRGFPRTVEDFHVESRKNLLPTKVTRFDLTGGGEVLEVLVVRDDDGGGSSKVGEVLLPFIKGFDNRPIVAAQVLQSFQVITPAPYVLFPGCFNYYKCTFVQIWPV